MRGIAGWADINNNFNELAVSKMAGSFSSCNCNKKFENGSGIYKNVNIRLLNRSIDAPSTQEYIYPMSINVPNLGEYTILYGGNLYNKKEVRDKLLSQGILVNSTSETELILKAFVKWGKDCLNAFNGIFSIAIWSSEKKELFLARDRIGVKSLFFYEYAEGIIFSSFVSTLLSNPLVEPLLDKNGLRELFLIGPGRTPGNGIVKDVKELLPGEYAIFSCKNKQLKRKLYWKLKAAEFKDSLSVTIEKTRFLVESSIKQQFQNKKPFCCLLSGGLDSSIVSKVASDYCKQNHLGQLTTYSVDYLNNDIYFKKSFINQTQTKNL